MFSGFKFQNTCTIDYLLFSLWLACQLGQTRSALECIKDYEHAKSVIDIVNAIEDKEWNKAKTI